MDHHFRAFSFVDRITAVEPGARITGSYVVPGGLAAFSSSLVAEAVGQLAAWAAMAAINFDRRPVAGLAGAIDLLGSAGAGQTLELSAVLESVDNEAVAYNGEARVAGSPVVRLHNCVGPMIPITDFDDPEALRDRFALLCGPGAKPGAFEGLPALAFAQTGGEKGQSVRASFQVPASAPLFADHFPRRPVFPGSLLMDLNLQLAASLARELPRLSNGSGWVLQQILDVKLRTFIPPGELLECEARLNERTPDGAVLGIETRKGNRVIGGARVRLAPERHG